MDSDDTIYAVKYGVQRKTRIPRCHQRLVLNGNRLCDGATVAGSNITPNISLNLLMDIQGGGKSIKKDLT